MEAVGGGDATQPLERGTGVGISSAAAVAVAAWSGWAGLYRGQRLWWGDDGGGGDVLTCCHFPRGKFGCLQYLEYIDITGITM